jgi:hypothetical protein
MNCDGKHVTTRTDNLRAAFTSLKHDGDSTNKLASLPGFIPFRLLLLTLNIHNSATVMNGTRVDKTFSLKITGLTTSRKI